jgi:DNA-binding transcriptional LysR family regulator
MRYLIATAEELNFTKAAARCNVSQPPLSRAIAQLEQEVGDRLFVRDSHNVTVTKAGQSLVEDARRAIESIEGGIQRAQRVAKGLRGTLSIGFGGTPAYWLWPTLVRQFRASVPDVQIKFVSLPVLEQIEALRERRIDLGIVRLPVHDELLSTTLIHREPLVVAVSSAAETYEDRQERPIKIDELATSKFVTYAPRRGFDYHSDLRALCRLAGFEPEIAHEGQTTEAVVGMVACGEGVAVLPADARRLRMHGVTFHPLDVTGVPERLACVEFALARNTEHNSPTALEFVQQAGRATTVTTRPHQSYK